MEIIYLSLSCSAFYISGQFEYNLIGEHNIFYREIIFYLSADLL